LALSAGVPGWYHPPTLVSSALLPVEPVADLERYLLSIGEGEPWIHQVVGCRTAVDVGARTQGDPRAL